MKSKNYIPQSFLFVFFIALIFSSLSLIDYDKISVGFPLKPVNMFSDVQVDEEDSTLFAEEIVIKPIVEVDETCPAGVECIQNFTDSKFPLDQLFNKLIAAKRGQTKVRIAWFGDSFTDADLVVSDLRDTLQSVFGGNGVGFVPITSEAPGYRLSVGHAFGGWNTSSVISRNGSSNFGINGFNYKPDSANFVRFAGSRKFKHTRKFDIFRLFYAANRPVEARISLNDTVRHNIVLPESSMPEMYTVGLNNIKKVKLNIPRTTGITIFGASLEDSTGFYIDNFSIKGNSGISLLSIPTSNMVKFDSLLNYDLVVMQFGLNAVSANTRNYTDYMDGMSKLIVKFRRVFPNTPILLFSVSDRSERKQGAYVTMKSIKGLVNAQQKLAYDNKLLFWNLYQAMGGENSMARFVASNPPLANKDYTHLNFQGGRKIGLTFARSFIHEKKKFEERRKNLVAN